MIGRGNVEHPKQSTFSEAHVCSCDFVQPILNAVRSSMQPTQSGQEHYACVGVSPGAPFEGEIA